MAVMSLGNHRGNEEMRKRSSHQDAVEMNFQKPIKEKKNTICLFMYSSCSGEGASLWSLIFEASAKARRNGEQSWRVRLILRGMVFQNGVTYEFCDIPAIALASR